MFGPFFKCILFSFDCIYPHIYLSHSHTRHAMIRSPVDSGVDYSYRITYTFMLVGKEGMMEPGG